jgi:hypothetical protein
MFAKALTARRAGASDEAIALLAGSAAALEETPAPFGKLVIRQELTEVLAEAGRLDEAAAVFGELTEFWRRAKATWYLGRLEEWARGLGVATDPG